MTDKELIQDLELIAASIEWDLPLDHQITIDKAIKKIQELKALVKQKKV